LNVISTTIPPDRGVSDQSSKLTPVIFRLPKSLLSRIDAFGEHQYIHRSEKMRALLAAGLRSEVANG
jgi:metal-responsive CopG/Arc/MetJ family transcriptional regulator